MELGKEGRLLMWGQKEGICKEVRHRRVIWGTNRSKWCSFLRTSHLSSCQGTREAPESLKHRMVRQCTYSSVTLSSLPAGQHFPFTLAIKSNSSITHSFTHPSNDCWASTLSRPLSWTLLFGIQRYIRSVLCPLRAHNPFGKSKWVIGRPKDSREICLIFFCLYLDPSKGTQWTQQANWPPQQGLEGIKVGSRGWFAAEQ